MRTLVEQTQDNVQHWLTNIWQERQALRLPAPAAEELLWLAGDGTPAHPAHSPIILMGGEAPDEAEREWDIPTSPTTCKGGLNASIPPP